MVFGEGYENCPKIKKKVFFLETNFEDSNINWKPLILSHDKIIMKFGQKKWMSLVLVKVYENCLKNEKKCYFRKPTSKRVISIGNHLFGPMIRL